MADKLPIVVLLLSAEENYLIVPIDECVQEQDALDFHQIISKYIEQIDAVLLVKKT